MGWGGGWGGGGGGGALLFFQTPGRDLLPVRFVCRADEKFEPKLSYFQMRPAAEYFRTWSINIVTTARTCKLGKKTFN